MDVAKIGLFDGESIDRPILDIVKRLNAMGFRTRCSCCGYNYRKQGRDKDHGTPYIFFSGGQAKKLKPLAHLTWSKWRWRWCRDYSKLSTEPRFVPGYSPRRRSRDPYTEVGWGSREYVRKCKDRWDFFRKALDKLEKKMPR